MNEPNWWIDIGGVPRATVLASFFGALVSLHWIDATIGWPTKLMMFGGGFLTAIFVTPLVQDLLALKEALTGGLAFFLGVFGMSLIDAIFVEIRTGRLSAALKARVGL